MGWWENIKGGLRGNAPERAPAPAPAEAPPPTFVIPPPPTAPAKRPKTIAARNRELEAAIRVDPRAVEPYLVYADWLLAEGDPRGELIAMQFALMEGAMVGKRLSELDRNEQLLCATHSRHLYGAAEMITSSFYLGFIRRLVVEMDSEVEHCRKLLAAPDAADDVATQFLATIVVFEERTRDELQRLVGDREIEVVMQDDAREDPLLRRAIPATVTCTPDNGHPSRIGILVEMDDLPTLGRAHAYSFLIRTKVETASATITWWFGSNHAAADEAFSENPPYSGEGFVPGTPSGTAQLSVRMRIHAGELPNAIDTMWLAIDETIDLSLERQTVTTRFVNAAPPPKDVPPDIGLFAESSPPEVVAATCGPALLQPSRDGSSVELRNPRGAALPRVGVFDEKNMRLVLSNGETRALSNLDPPTGNNVREMSYGGSGGVFCLVSNSHSGSAPSVLSFVVVGSVEQPRSLDLKDFVYAASFNEDGSKFAVLTQGVRAPSCFQVIDVESLTVLASAPWDVSGGLAGDREVDPYVDWWRGEPFVYRSGLCSALNLETKSLHTRAAPRGVQIDRRHFGARSTAYHPEPNRAAWMMSIEPPDLELHPEGGLSLIAWSTGPDERHGAVIVPDFGTTSLEYDSRFAKVSVLEDGRIVAIGTHVWLVEFDNEDKPTAFNMGKASSYGSPLPITKENGVARLWSRGPGPWWVNLDRS